MSLPCFINEHVVAPVCPQSAAQLFEVSLTFQDGGQHGHAYRAILAAQQAWEEALLREHFPDIEDAVANSILLQLRLKDEEEDNAKSFDADATLDEVENERLDAVKEAKRAFDEEREIKRLEKIQALHTCYQLLPIEGKIFIQLRLSSISQSAGSDEKALHSALQALKFCQTLPVYTDNVMMGSCLNAIGIIYAHLGQFDYAADYFFRCLEIRDEALTMNHVESASVLHNIGCCLCLMGRHSDGLVMYYNALKTLRLQLPENHPRIELCEVNIRKAKPESILEIPKVVPFVPGEGIPVIPGVKKARQMFQVKAKTAKK